MLLISFDVHTVSALTKCLNSSSDSPVALIRSRKEMGFCYTRHPFLCLFYLISPTIVSAACSSAALTSAVLNMIATFHREWLPASIPFASCNIIHVLPFAACVLIEIICLVFEGETRCCVEMSALFLSFPLIVVSTLPDLLIRLLSTASDCFSATICCFGPLPCLKQY